MLKIEMDVHDILHSMILRANTGGAFGGQASKLPPHVLAIPGLTSEPVRHFLNLICKGVNYLEVGSLMGATLTAAAWGNPGTFHAIDNFSEWQTVQQLLTTGLELQGEVFPYKSLSMEEAHRKARKETPHAIFHQMDFHEFALEELAGHPLDVFYYDADHTTQATVDGILHFAPAFADEMILLVDDWNHPDVRAGVQQAMNQIPFELATMFQLTWWNGFLVALLQKMDRPLVSLKDMAAQ